MAGAFKYDLFISHATEDKALVARPLATALSGRGLSVWLDERSLILGEGLTEGILDGLLSSEFGAVILSPAFLEREWTLKELHDLSLMENHSGDRIILPIWHKLDLKVVSERLPELSDRLAARTSDGIDAVAELVSAAIAAWRDRQHVPGPLLAQTGTLNTLLTLRAAQDKRFKRAAALSRGLYEDALRIAKEIR